MDYVIGISVAVFAICNLGVSIFNYFTFQRNIMLSEKENKNHKEQIKRLEFRLIATEKEGTYWLQKSLRNDSPVAVLVHNNGMRLVTQTELAMLTDSKNDVTETDK